MLLPAATKLGQGNIFTSVCQEFCPRGGGGGCLPQCMLGFPPGADPPGPGTPPEQTPRDQTHTPRTRPTPPEQTSPPGPDPHPREADCSIRSTSGRYASYWNAFLFRISSKQDQGKCFEALFRFKYFDCDPPPQFWGSTILWQSPVKGVYKSHPAKNQLWRFSATYLFLVFRFVWYECLFNKWAKKHHLLLIFVTHSQFQTKWENPECSTSTD